LGLSGKGRGGDVEPTTVIAIVAASILLAMGVTLAAFAYGRGTRGYQIKRMAEDVEVLRVDLVKIRDKARARSRGARTDLERDAAVSVAADIERMLQQFPSAAGADPLAGKPNRRADP
jgi:hypothetical protein